MGRRMARNIYICGKRILRSAQNDLRGAGCGLRKGAAA